MEGDASSLLLFFFFARWRLHNNKPLIFFFFYLPLFSFYSPSSCMTLFSILKSIKSVIITIIIFTYSVLWVLFYFVAYNCFEPFFVWLCVLRRGAEYSIFFFHLFNGLKGGANPMKTKPKWLNSHLHYRNRLLYVCAYCGLVSSLVPLLPRTSSFVFVVCLRLFLQCHTLMKCN